MPEQEWDDPRERGQKSHYSGRGSRLTRAVPLGRPLLRPQFLLGQQRASELFWSSTVPGAHQPWLLGPGNGAGVTGELNFLILITLNVNLNSHICWLVATILDNVILNLSLCNYEMGLITESSLLGSL